MINEKMKITITLFFVFLMVSFVSAGQLIEVDGFTMYSNDYGEIAKDTWLWIDTNKDSIDECYRFEQNGHLSINYKDKYGKETNEFGQLIENGEVIKKMLSNGEILNKKKTPENEMFAFLGDIINYKPKYEKDKWTGEEIEINYYETNDIKETIDGQVLYGKNNYQEDIDILDGETAETGVIYSSAKSSEISDGVNYDSDIVAGKDYRNFIISKNKCDEKVIEVYVYGGNRWNDVLVLNGNGASVKFELNKNNYIRFEVAVTIGLTSIALNIVANLVTIYCCNRVISSVQRNDVLNEIAKILRKGGK